MATHYCLFGWSGFLLTGTLPRIGGYHEIDTTYKLYFELAGLAWMLVMILMPEKNQSTSQTQPIKERQNWEKISILSFLFLILFLFKFLAIGFDVNTLFRDKWEQSHSNINMCILLLFLAGIVLFHLRKKAGWLLTMSYFMYLELNSLSYILWLIWIKHTQTLYEVHISGFSIIYVFCYGWCLYLLFRKNLRGNFSIGKKHLIAPLILTSAISFILFWNDYHR